MKPKADRLLASCSRQLGLETSAEKRWFIAAFALLFVYLWLCQYMRNYLKYDITSGVACSILFPALQVLPLCVFGVMLFSKFRIPDAAGSNFFPRLRRFFPVLAFAVTFGYLLLWLVAYYPGGFCVDNIYQLSQVYYGYFDNWHPVLHTWPFYWIPWQIYPVYTRRREDIPHNGVSIRTRSIHKPCRAAGMRTTRHTRTLRSYGDTYKRTG